MQTMVTSGTALGQLVLAPEGKNDLNFRVNSCTSFENYFTPRVVIPIKQTSYVQWGGWRKRGRERRARGGEGEVNNGSAMTAVNCDQTTIDAYNDFSTKKYLNSSNIYLVL